MILFLVTKIDVGCAEVQGIARMHIVPSTTVPNYFLFLCQFKPLELSSIEEHVKCSMTSLTVAESGNLV